MFGVEDDAETPLARELDMAFASEGLRDNCWKFRMTLEGGDNLIIKQISLYASLNLESQSPVDMAVRPQTGSKPTVSLA